MTSLKKHIDAYERSLLAAAVEAYCAALACIGRDAERAVPVLKGGLRIQLSLLAERLRKDTTSTTFRECQSGLDAELGRWGDKVVGHLQEKTAEVKEMMLTLAAAAERISHDHKGNSTRLTELIVRLHSIARLEDIGAIRRQLHASTDELKANVARMEEQGRATVQHLQREIDTYRARAAESERRSLIDELTGLRNRRGLEAAIQGRLERQSVFCLMLLDLNRFKEINDTHGHLVGDELLRQFSSELRDQFRPGDVVGRWGGDEFIVITDSSPSELEASATRIRRWVLGTYKIKTPRGSLEVKLDAAIGVAAWDLREDGTQLIARADALMYKEKRTQTLT